MTRNMSFINRILDSKYFKEALQKGEDIIQKDQLGLLNLIKRALLKVTEKLYFGLKQTSCLL